LLRIVRPGKEDKLKQHPVALENLRQLCGNFPVLVLLIRAQAILSGVFCARSAGQTNAKKGA
jgi:hypothetical protein